MSNTAPELTTLIANYQAAEQRVNDLAILWDKPVCGVPHFGYKAARKAKHARYDAGVQLLLARNALRAYVTTDKKRSYQRRQQLTERIVSAVPSFTLV